MRPTVALRLTLWYTLVFVASSALAMVVAYSSVAGVLRADGDAELRQDAEETASLVRRGGAEAFAREIEHELAGPDSSAAFLRLWGADGEPVASIGFAPPDRRAREAAARARGGAEVPVRRTHDARSAHGLRVACAAAGDGLVVEFGHSLEAEDELLAALRNGMLLAVPIVLLLAVPIGWFLARRALAGVEVVTRTALEIADGAMERRVPVGRRGDDLDRLAWAFNRMLDRIGALIRALREVTDGLAHDLRTPLTRIRASAERAASRGGAPEEWLAFAETTTEECDRLLQIVNGTLEIAEAQAGAAPLDLRELDLSELVHEARDVFVTLAEDAGIALDVEAAGRCAVLADRSRVQRIVANLLDNAVKFTPPGGRIVLSVAPEADAVRLEVRDTGIGVDAEDLPRIFERFYRGDGSRTGRGSGLGLSLARAFARAHGGDLTAVSAPGRGSTFTLRLRRAPG